MAVPVYKLYSGSTAFYFGALNIRKQIQKSMDTIELPYTTTRYLIDEQLPIQTIQIQGRCDIGVHYSTAALLETAISNVINLTGGVFLDAGTVSIDGASFSSDSSLPFRVTSGGLLIKSLDVESRSEQPYIYDIRITLELGTSVF